MTDHPIAIVAAVDDEIRVLRSKMQIDAKLVRGSCEILRGLLWKRPTLLVRSGMGRRAMAEALTLCCRFQTPREIVHIGCLGALSPELSTGDLLLADGVIDAEGGERFPVDPARVAEAVAVWKKQEGMPTFQGTIATLDRLVIDPHEKAFIGTHHGAQGIDMESAEVVKFAAEQRIPCVVARAVFDPLDMCFPDIRSLLDGAGRPRPLPLLRHLLLHPKEAKAFMRMGYCMMKAREAITRFAEAWVQR